MACKICGRSSCTESFHSIREQEEHEKKEGGQGMKLKLHTYSGGQMVLAFETENECEKNLVKFFYGESASLDKR